MGGIMLAIVMWDMYTSVLPFAWGIGALIVGVLVGLVSTRIFHLSWSRDGGHVVGRIDKIGWFVLAAYIAFEIARATLFETVIHIGTSMTTAVTFAFVSAALLSRVFGLRGRILRIIKAEKVLG